jgi:hypothetical protein
MKKIDKLKLAYHHIYSILCNDIEGYGDLNESVRIRLFRVKNLLTDLMEKEVEQPTNHEG